MGSLDGSIKGKDVYMCVDVPNITACVYLLHTCTTVIQLHVHRWVFELETDLKSR